jgi:hypothetical protein
MSFFTIEEITSLKINSMILHVVGDGNFQAEKERKVEYEDFFIRRILATDVSSVYSFSDNSQTKFKIQDIASRNVGFEKGAQELSQAFSLAHVGSSKDGAFFIFELGCSVPDTLFYSLIKYDYSEVIEQNDAAPGGLLRKVVRAFIADKRAIQKSAIIRVAGGVAESEISTTDRVKSSVDISDYFEKFLDASRARSDQELNEKAKDVLINSLRECKDILPDKNFSKAFNKAVGVLRDRVEITEDSIAESVIAAAGNPQDEESIVALQNSVSRNIRKLKLVGLKFKPDLSVLKKPPTRKIKTTEGVTITFPDDLTDAVVKVVDKTKGGSTITVETKKVTEDTLLRDKAR